MAPRYAAPFAAHGAEPMDAERARKLLEIALARGGDYAELFFEYCASGSFSFDEGILKSAGRAVTLGLGVRVLRADATGYAYVEDLSPESMEHAARTASSIAAGARGRVAPVFSRPRMLKDHYPVREPSIEVPSAAKRALLERADHRARAADACVRGVDASLAEEIREILIVTSDGKMYFDRQPLLRFGVRVRADTRTHGAVGSSGGGGRVGLDYFEARSPEFHADEAVRHARVMLEAWQAPTGAMDVVLGPGNGMIFQSFGHCFEADFHLKETSVYLHQLGQRVATEHCTLVDDATLPHWRGSINVDDEGTRTSSHRLIDRGVLCGLIHDRRSAARFKVEPTGHGRRESFKSHPMPRMTNIVLLGGAYTREEIIGSVQQGVYVAQLGGAHVDVANGDFVASITEGYMIEGGRLTAPIRDANLIGNVAHALQGMTMVGNDQARSEGVFTCGKDGQSVPVGVGCPTVKLGGMYLGAETP